MSPRSFLDQWERCAPWLDAALERGGRTHELADVRYLVLNEPETYWFWPGERSAAVSEIVRYPRLRVFRFWLAAGDLEEIKRAEPDLVAHAIMAGCTRFELIGRPGWKRAFRELGYVHRADVCWKELSA